MDEINGLLNKMKEAGIESILIRKDGIKTHSTISLDDNNSKIIALLANTADAMMKLMKDKSNEVEISTDQGYVIILPIKEFHICALVENREKKPILREGAKRIAEYL